MIANLSMAGLDPAIQTFSAGQWMAASSAVIGSEKQMLAGLGFA